MSTSSSAIAYESRRAASLRLAGYLELVKPRITALVLVTVVAGALAGDPTGLGFWLLCNTLVGTALVGASTGAMNQWLERRVDALMPRTAERPLPSGRLSGGEVLSFGLVTFLLGTVYLALAVNTRTALVGIVAWTLYVWIYTPLKPRTTLNTAIGAVGGALPAVMGWAATGKPLNLAVGVLFVAIYLWQFPHFMAIAWIYRNQYRRAGLKMLPVVDPSGRLAGRQGLVAALMLLPVSLLPAVSVPFDSTTAAAYFLLAAVLNFGYIGFAARFYLRRDDVGAQSLLLASLVYLPALLILFTTAVLGVA